MRRILTAVLIAACASCARGTPPAGSGGPDAQGNPSASAPATNGSNDPARGSKGSAVSSLPSDVSTTSAPKASQTKHPIKLEVTMDRTCVQPGGRIEVVAVTEKGAQVGFTAYYPADNDYVPDFYYVPKEANVTGTVTWNLVLRPDTPLGRAQLYVLASKSPKSGVFQGEFTVARLC